ncbi:energy-coupling factor ABC transporter ATP-binding protein [Rubrobacter marinus]|uniref:energy-coupling factor ABC transporter ATP-binding protein n=1 Tax=Rubrobacter marinus TaxID=2653852 RepID=UPI00224BA510|nr:ATP-binding cassette domain-containing protein [Rubrobacter marinus]
MVGGTGSGKSTMVQHLNLLLEPTSGEVLVDGVDARGGAGASSGGGSGSCSSFRRPRSSPDRAGGRGLRPRRMGLGEGEVRERVDGVLERLGIGHLGERVPHSLSGGEKRRAAISGVLAMGPEVLVLDEPTAGLDPATREELLGVIRALRGDGKTVVLVSHDLDEVAEVADRVCVMRDGRIERVGTPGEVFYAGAAAGPVPATVRVAAPLREGHPEINKPVSFEETLAALKATLGQ